MIYGKNDQQSAKDILEDIKKVMHSNGYNKSSIADQKLNSEIPHFQHDEEDEDDEFLDFEDKSEESEILNNVSNHPNESLINATKTEHENMQKQESESLLSKENIDAVSAEVQHLIEEVDKSCKLSKGYSLTLEELAIKLLEPQLKEWLNNHLHNLVKEIVEKEIRYITGK